jgi:outer membrane PBP1 activator LpoA protein
MQPIRHGTLVASLLALVVLAAGCAPSITQRPLEPAEDPLARQARELARTGEPLRAAEILLELARSAEPRAAAVYRLSGAEYLLQAGRADQAGSVLDAVDPSALDSEGRLRLRMARAAIELRAGRPEAAIAALGPAPDPSASPALKRRYYGILADTARLAGNYWESARALAELDRWIDDPRARVDNQIAILQSLAGLPERTAADLRQTAGAVMTGWLDLALLIRRNAADPDALRPALGDWRQRHPAHPAEPALIDAYLDRFLGRYRKPDQVAVLLPLRGPFAEAAQALADGILAAYYDQPAERRPALRVYDSTDPADTWPQFQKALDEGADVVLGPLQKESVAQLARAGELPVPVLALNRVDLDSAPPPSLFQFGLVPEEEARLAAERAWLSGHRRAVVLWPEGDWGQRLLEAFRDRFESLGGLVVESRSYPPAENDFSEPIRALLNLDASEARHRDLQRLFGQRLEFEPRRRQDADLVFLAANVVNARKIRPQLQFHHAADLPVYATSHVFSGRPAPGSDVDLEGVRFPDMPWLLVEDPGADLSLDAMASVLPGSRDRYQRFYPMGVDSYRLIPHLARLQFSPRESLDGVTGVLSLDSLNRVNRRLLWARFEDGVPRVEGYAPAMDSPGEAGGPAAFGAPDRGAPGAVVRP